MNIPLTWTGVGVILAIIAHAVLLVRGWTIIEMRLKSVTDSFGNLNESLKLRDARIEAAWKKIDSHESRITVVETKCHINHDKEE